MFNIFAPLGFVSLPTETPNNTEALQASMTVHRTLDGELTTYSRLDPNEHYTRKYDFTAVTNTTYMAFIDLVFKSGADIIHFEDSVGLVFTGRLSPGDIVLTTSQESEGIIYRDFGINIKGAQNV